MRIFSILRHALFREVGALRLLVDLEIGVLLQLVDDPVDLVVLVGRFLGRTRYDEGRPRLVDQDAVHLVDDGVVELPLHELVEGVLHVVPQIVEAELVVRPVGHVTAVGFLSLRVVEAVNHDADGHAEELVEGPHPFGIAPGEVVVDGHHVHAEAREGVEIDGKRGDEGLSLSGRHLCDLPLVEHDAAYELGRRNGAFRGFFSMPPGQWRRPRAGSRRGPRRSQAAP